MRIVSWRIATVLRPEDVQLQSGTFILFVGGLELLPLALFTQVSSVPPPPPVSFGKLCGVPKG